MYRPKIAVVGAGLIGADHIKLVAEGLQCELAGVVDSNPEAKKLADQHQASYYQTLEELLDSGELDGVIIATPNNFHVDQGIQCIEAGISVLIEKPVAHSLEEGQRLLEVSHRCQAKCLVGHHRAHSPIMEMARRVIDKGRLGELVAITGHALFYKPDHYFAQGPWRTELGGGPILINLIHEIGNLRYLCGEIIEVQAMVSNARRQFSVEDTVSINFRFASGTMGSFVLSDTASSSLSWEQTSRENKAFATYEQSDCYVVVGTQGSLQVPTMQLQRFDNDVEPSWWNSMIEETISIKRRDPLICQLEHFCALIRGEVESKVSIFDGLQNVKIIDAINRSASSGRSVIMD